MRGDSTVHCPPVVGLVGSTAERVVVSVGLAAGLVVAGLAAAGLVVAGLDAAVVVVGVIAGWEAQDFGGIVIVGGSLEFEIVDFVVLGLVALGLVPGHAQFAGHFVVAVGELGLAGVGGPAGPVLD